MLLVLLPWGRGGGSRSPDREGRRGDTASSGSSVPEQSHPSQTMLPSALGRHSPPPERMRTPPERQASRWLGPCVVSLLLAATGNPKAGCEAACYVRTSSAPIAKCTIKPSLIWNGADDTEMKDAASITDVARATSPSQSIESDAPICTVRIPSRR